MKKIPTLFKRDMTKQPARVYDEVTPGCEWVLEGEGWASVKIDGTCCKIEGGLLYKRREIKKGKDTPEGFIEEEFDKVTGKRFGWLPVTLDKSDKYHRQAFDYLLSSKDHAYHKIGLDFTYELVGPKIQGNAENHPEHVLIRHGDKLATSSMADECPRTFQNLREWLNLQDIEGIVWWHKDGRKAKIKKKDFGLSRKE